MPSFRAFGRRLAGALAGGATGTWARGLAIAAAVALIGTVPVKAADFSDAQKTEIESIVKAYILKNPEIVQQAFEELTTREKAAEAAARAKSLSDVQGPLYSSPNEAIVGNPAGKITLVEFFDYNCGYCKKMLPDLARLIKANPDLKVILRDFPVLSDASIDAATIAAGVRDQFKGEKFWEYHQRLLGLHGLVGKEQAVDLAQQMGADMPRLVRDAQTPQAKAGLEESFKFGRLLQIQGTPSYVVGDAVVDGAVGFDELQNKVNNVRKCGKTVCS
jgi:protein-disulfide isomerase